MTTVCDKTDIHGNNPMPVTGERLPTGEVAMHVIVVGGSAGGGGGTSPIGTTLSTDVDLSTAGAPIDLGRYPKGLIRTNGVVTGVTVNVNGTVYTKTLTRDANGDVVAESAWV